MGNHQISITAEFVSLIKSKTNPKYDYFVSNKAKKIFWFLSKIFSKRKVAEIFSNRIKISDEFDKFLEKNSFDCIVEFGCGYSLRGFEYSLKNEKSLYIDTDFSASYLYECSSGSSDGRGNRGCSGRSRNTS